MKPTENQIKHRNVGALSLLSVVSCATDYDATVYYLPKMEMYFLSPDKQEPYLNQYSKILDESARQASSTSFRVKMKQELTHGLIIKPEKFHDYIAQYETNTKSN